MILVPALLLLIGVVVYKKVIEPKRGQEKPAKETKTKSTPKSKARAARKSEVKAQPKSEPKRQAVAKAKSASSGRMGSVL